MKFEGFLNDDWRFLKPNPWPKLKKRMDKLDERVARIMARSKAKVESEERTYYQ